MVIALLRIAAWLRLQPLRLHLWWVQKTNPSRRHGYTKHLGCINPAEVRLMGAVRWWQHAVKFPVWYFGEVLESADGEETSDLHPVIDRYTPDAREAAEDNAYDEIMDRLELPYPEPVHVKMTDEEADERLRQLCAAVKAGTIK